MIVLCGIMLTGCTQLIVLTEEESDILSEYMAETVLKHDKKYKEALIYPEDTTDIADSETNEVNESEVASDTEGNMEAVSEQANSDDNLTTLDSTVADNTNYMVSDMNLSDELGNGNFEISYSNYKLYDSYPSNSKNNYFSLEASEGRKLLVVSFDIKNLSKKTQRLNLIKSGFEYTLSNDSNVTYNPKLTLLLNDIQYLDIEVPKGKSKEAVLVFEVLQDMDVSKCNLLVSNQEKNAVINLNN